MISNNNIHPFDNYTASASLVRPRNVLLLIAATVLCGLVAAKLELMGIGVLFGLIIAIVYLYVLFTRPVVGLYTSIALGFVLIGMGRYVKDVQVGLGMDAILILTYLALFMNRFKERVDWRPAKKDITLFAVIWFAIPYFNW